MTRSGTITMSMRELERMKVIEAVGEERLMTWRAAERLGLSERQDERLVKRYATKAPRASFRSGAARAVTVSCRRSCLTVALGLIVSATPILVRRWRARNCANVMA